MSTVEEIETAIKKLPPPKAWEVANWLNEYLDDEWDHQMREDAKLGGKLDRYLGKIKASVERGSISEINC